MTKPIEEYSEPKLTIKTEQSISTTSSKEPKKYDCNQTAFTNTKLPDEYKKALEQLSLKERDTLMFSKWKEQPITVSTQEYPLTFRKGIQYSMPAVTGYIYNGSIHRWIDGDTLEVVLDLGLKITHKTIVRLYGLNAPEKNTEEGKQLIEYLNKEYPSTTPIVIQTIKDKKEKYGRYLGIIYSKNTNINDYLLANNLAKILNY